MSPQYLRKAIFLSLAVDKGRVAYFKSKEILTSLKVISDTNKFSSEIFKVTDYFGIFCNE